MSPRAASLAAAGLLLAAAAFSQERLAGLRLPEPALAAGAARAGGLTPGMILATRLLGGLRSLLVDFLWVRASLSEENKDFWEIEPLVELILALQPRNAEVRIFHAWNLSYNIPGNNWPGESDEEGAKRWSWIWRGVRLLQEGQAISPRETAYPAELGLLFGHKPPFDAYFKRLLEAAPAAGGRGCSPWNLAREFLTLAVGLARAGRLAPEPGWFSQGAYAAEMRGEELAASGRPGGPALAAAQFERAVSFCLAARAAWAGGAGERALLALAGGRLARLRRRAAECRRLALAQPEEVTPSPVHP